MIFLYKSYIYMKHIFVFDKKKVNKWKEFLKPKREK